MTLIGPFSLLRQRGTGPLRYLNGPRIESSARHLAFHGSVVLLFGLLCGGPYARAIKRAAPAHIVHAWRVAHASLPIGAILMIAVSAVLSS